MENMYLKRLVKEMEEKNQVLTQSNGLLCEKVNRLEEEICRKNVNRGAEVPARSYRNVVVGSVGNGLPELPEQMAAISHAGGPTQVRHVTVTGSGRGSQSVEMDGIEGSSGHQDDGGVMTSQRRVSLSKRMSSTEIRAVNQGGQNQNAVDVNNFTTSDAASRRQFRPRPKKRLGTGENFEGAGGSFGGEERKAWLYLYRVKKTATAEIIRSYIQGKAGFQNINICVRELPGSEGQLKSFVVVVPIEKKDEMYELSFWPKYVGIKRFDFQRHKDFLSTAGSFFV